MHSCWAMTLVYLVEIHRTSPNLILHSGTQCTSSDEASHLKLHHGPREAGYAMLGCHVDGRK
jgi:hypothetical protein